MLHQRLRLKTGAVQRQRPGLTDAANVWQRLFYDDAAHALSIENFEDQIESSLVEAQEVGDGNLNLVFKIFDAQGVSRIIVKQALPYVRCVGESWPLTLDPARPSATKIHPLSLSPCNIPSA